MNQFGFSLLTRYSEIVRISNGELQGLSDGKSESFLGVPFALPPTGRFRFMRPQSISGFSWEGVKHARKTAPMCLQRAGFFLSTPITGSEDCLYLNVYRPVSVSSGDDLPVMVFIPGGAFSVGGSYWMQGQSDGSVLAHQENVIVVVLSYRLNVMGFLATEQLQAANGGTVGNLGLQDQQEALRWVKREINFFGGDPDRVLLFGESAGAFSVLWHSINIASRDEKLFSSVIAQSASSDLSWFYQQKDQAFQLYDSYVKFLGCPSDKVDQLGCLQSIKAEQFLEAWGAWSESFLRGGDKSGHLSPEEVPLLQSVSGFGPVVDGHVAGMLDVPYRLIEKGEFHRVPFVAGITRDEGSIFSLVIPPTVISQQILFAPERWKEIFGLILTSPESLGSLHALYPFNKPGDAVAGFQWSSEIIRDFVFGCSTEETALNWSKYAPAYLYLFSGTLGSVGAWTGVGAMHSFDIFYIFRTFPPGTEFLINNGREQKVASEMGARWASMARTGSPNPTKSDQVMMNVMIEWPEYKSSEENILEFGGVGNLKDPPSRLIDRNAVDKTVWPEKEKCSFWKTQRPLPWIHLSTKSVNTKKQI